MIEKAKTCSRCGSAKSLDDFKTDIRKPDGKASSCKACNSVPKVADLPVARSKALVPVYDPLDPAGWIARIAERWRASVDAIFDVGRLLIEAKAALPHGGWGSVLAGIPLGDRQVQMLMAIAADARLSNPQYIALLPASWGTIYDLTRLADDELERGFEQHIIRPDMIRADVEFLRPLLRRPHLESSQEVRPDTVNVPTAGSNPASPATDECAPMPSGGLAIAHRRIEPEDSLDFFPTPLWATRALIERVLLHLDRKKHCYLQRAWEPACGKGHMAEVLREYFREVHATDIADYNYGDDTIDFLGVKASGADWIITNPPFGDKTEAFVLKAIELAGTGVAMFVRLQWLESVGRYEKIFRPHPPTLVSIFSERVPLHKGRWEEDGATMTAYMWLVWIKGAEPRAPFWIPPGQREALTKPGDGKRFGSKTKAEDEAA